MTMVKTTLRSAYLAGPMRGIEDYNFPAFRRETEWLRQEGWHVFSPAERDENDPDIDHEANVAGWSGSRGLDYFMAHDLKAVCEHDAVICLPGWENSQGARLETVTAIEVGHPVFVIEEEWNGQFLVDKRLRAVDAEYVQAVFQARGIPEREDYDPVPDEMRDEGMEAFARLEEKAQEGLRRLVSAPSVFAVAASTLPSTTAERKAIPLARGVLDYFPAALAEVAKVSKAGNDKHNPGQDMHHARGKSTDHADCLLRHLVDRGKTDVETGERHSAEVAWRALALLQQELEDEGLAPLPRGARLPEEES